MTESSLPVLSGGIPPEVPYIKLPRAGALFKARAERLRALAAGHAAGDWLAAMAAVCQAQDRAAVALVGSGPPGVVDFSPRTPLGHIDWAGDSHWHSALQGILATLASTTLPEAARAAVERLRVIPRDRLSSWAGALAGGDGQRPDAACAPLVGAAMQVHLAAIAEHLPVGRIARAETDCPVCAAPAACGMVMGDDKVRYLHCSLCASAWHRVRVQCATCGSPGALSYYAIDRPTSAEGGGAVGAKAEACSDCHTYLKLFYQEERPETEPIADDLGTIALDLLVGEAGFARGGVNLYLAAW